MKECSRQKHMLTKIDKTIIILITIAALLSLPLALSASTNANKANLIVFKDGKKDASYSMEGDKRIKITGAEGGFCLLHIKKGKASIEKSTCPNKICQKMGPIQNAGQMIVCAPMRLMFQIESQQNDSLDAVNE